MVMFSLNKPHRHCYASFRVSSVLYGSTHCTPYSKLITPASSCAFSPTPLLSAHSSVIAQQSVFGFVSSSAKLKMSSKEEEVSTDNFDYEIIIVGAGVAGASAAHHLSKQKDLTDNKILVLDAGPDAGEGVKPRSSGSATMPNDVAPCIKMMVQLYAGSTADFSKHHGTEGCRRYLTATREGLKLQQGIANTVWSSEEDTSQCIKPLGSYYVAYAQDREALREEFESLADLGEDICPGLAWIDSAEELQQVPGLQGLKFDCAIHFPNDCVIDSSEYAKAVLQHVTTSNENVTFRPNTRVKHVAENENGGGCVVVTLESGETLSARHVVMATGGLHQDISALNGILKPCYSYLVHVPTNADLDASPNFFTWGFTHDWCFTNGSVRTSGEDHFSAYKPPLYKERCQRLSQWTLEQYGCNTDNVDYDAFGPQYGVYSETPDMAPLIGSLNNGGSVTYLLGCNAWGQTILSYCSSLIPGLLGYQPLTQEQRDIMKLVSIRRFSELPSASL